ncbi:MAG: ATP-binding protein, partial [Acidimicrobiia bacterium]|nr:ATP-binding protein [Acidimicrobiia bacterium]
ALDDGHVVVSAVDASESNRLSAVRRDFVADASHELKTPIAAIQSSAETLRVALAHGDLDAADKFTAYVIENTTRLGHLVNDLLDLSRIESETLDVSPIDLAAIVIDQVDSFRTAATKRNITLEVAATTAMVAGDANHLSMAVRNLIANAIQNTAERGTVQVAIHCGDATAEVTVSDNGRGIPSRDLPRLFERFYRVDHARSRTDGGTGLGLAIVKHVAENHGGSIDVESALGEGSAFTLRIPRTQG